MFTYYFTVQVFNNLFIHVGSSFYHNINLRWFCLSIIFISFFDCFLRCSCQEWEITGQGHDYFRLLRYVAIQRSYANLHSHQQYITLTFVFVTVVVSFNVPKFSFYLFIILNFLFYFILFWATPRSLWDFNSLTRGWTWPLGSDSMES